MQNNLKNEIIQIILEISNKNIPARIVFDRYLREKRFNSKLRRDVSDYFYDVLAFSGELKKDPNSFDLEKVKEKFFNSEVNEEILAELCGFNKEISKKIINSLEDPDDFKFYLKRAPLTVRVNNLKINRDSLFQNLSKNYSINKTKYSPFGIKFNEHINVRSLKEFKEGLFEIQDEASQLISICNNVVPNMRVLDYCAGTGGKSLALYDRFFGGIQIDAHDVSKKRLDVLKKRAIKINADIKINKNPKNNYYDFVIVDAPCSGLGSLRRDRDLNLRLSPERLEELIVLQREVFDNAVKKVRDGGYIFYVTCSILKDENEFQYKYFINKYKFLKKIPLSSILDNNLKNIFDNYFKTSPKLDEMDAFFGVIFQKIK